MSYFEKILNYRLNRYKHSCNRAIKCCSCCLWCFEKFVIFINKNAYIEIGENLIINLLNSFEYKSTYLIELNSNLWRFILCRSTKSFYFIINQCFTSTCFEFRGRLSSIFGKSICRDRHCTHWNRID